MRDLPACHPVRRASTHQGAQRRRHPQRVHRAAQSWLTCHSADRGNRQDLFRGTEVSACLASILSGNQTARATPDMAPPDGLKPNMSTAITRTARAVNLSTMPAREREHRAHPYRAHPGDGDTPAHIADVEPLSGTRLYGGPFNDPGTIVVTPILSGLHDRYARI
jgi:hypothetical protein